MISMLKARVLNSINEIDEHRWDSIVEKDHLISSYRFLQAVEASGINVCFYKYIVVDDGDKPAAHTCIYKMYFELDVLAGGMVKRMANRIRSFWPGFLRLAFLECGTPVALGNTISYAPDADRRKALDAIVNKMEEVAGESRTGVMLLRDFYEEELRLYDYLKLHNFVRSATMPNTFLKIRWNSFDEYCAALRSHYRCKITHNIKKAREDEVTAEAVINASAYNHQLYQLWENVYEHAKEFRREKLTPQFFGNIGQYLQERHKIIVFRKDKKIVCFGFLLVDDYTLRLVFSGMDYQYNKQSAVYFNMLYEVIKLGIGLSKKQIEMGITTYFPKSDLGLENVYLYAYMKHRNPFLSKIISSAFKLMAPKIPIGCKSVFK